MKKALVSLALFATVVLAYLPCTRYGFVSHDDQEYVYENPLVKGGLTASNVVWAIKSCGYACNWHPLAWMSLQSDATAERLVSPAARSRPVAEERIDSLRPLAHVMHVHSVILHAANAVLLFWLILAFLRRSEDDPRLVLVSALAAALWAIHPLRTEIVCWISERKELSSVFFMLLTLIAYVGREVQVESPSLYILSLVFFSLALLAKPVAVSLPAALFAWDWVVCRKGFVRSVLKVVPFGVLSLGAACMTLAAQTKAVEVGCCYTVMERIIMSVNAPVIYLRQTLVPMGLSAFYPIRPPVPWAETILGVVLLLATGGTVIWYLRTRKSDRGTVLSTLVFGIAWAYVALLPMLGIVKVGDQTHSDRYTYWTGCALVAVLMMLCRRWIVGREEKVTKGLVGVLAVLMVLTWQRQTVWSSSMALYCDSIPKSWSPQAVCALAQEFRRKGEDGFVRAEALLREALSHTKDIDVRAEYANLMAFKTDKSFFRLDDKGPDPAFDEVRMEAEYVLHYEPKNLRANEAMAVVSIKEENWTNAVRYLVVARESGKDLNWIDEELENCKAMLPKE